MRGSTFMVLQRLDDSVRGSETLGRVNNSLGTCSKAPHKDESSCAQAQTLPHFDLPRGLAQSSRQGQRDHPKCGGHPAWLGPHCWDDHLLIAGIRVISASAVAPGDASGADRLFNGALDNAAGIAVLMQVARDLRKGKAPRRSIVFAAVTGEEKGLLGSRAYVAQAQAEGRRMVANLNSDMFLPLYPFKHLVVFGLEESDLADDARAVAAELGLQVQSDPQPQRKPSSAVTNTFIRAGFRRWPR